MFKQKHSKGQALVEFAIVAIVLFLIFFLIIEMGRILWSWVTVQSAARSGARYAITGQFEPDCLSDTPPCTNPRVISITDVVESRLTGLNINDDPNAQYEDDNALFIEIYGVDSDDGVLYQDFAGDPGQPMVVRVIYNVPILTPILSNIVTNVPVMGQVTVTNERFGQLGAINEGQSVPVPIPEIPTAGPTETFTPTPTPTTTATSTPGPPPTATSSHTPTPTNTPAICAVRFEDVLYENQPLIPITGEIDTQVTLTDLTDGVVLGGPYTLVGGFNDHFCEGFTQVSLPNGVNLIENHVILLESSDGSFDVEIVQEGFDTPTPPPSATPQPTNTPTNTPPPASPTPTGPFIYLDPNCAFGPNIQFRAYGFNWDNNEAVNIYFDGQFYDTIQAGHGGSFARAITKSSVSNKVYQVVAQSSSATFSASLEVPCPNVTATPTVNASPTPIIPADLIISEPTLVSSPPIIGYEPVTFTVSITNTGNVDVNDLFFVDVFFDPPVVDPVGIDLSYSAGYRAVSSLAGSASRAITITSDIGFQGSETNRTVYSMVDSVKQISESVEDNNIGGAPSPLNVVITPGAATPTPAAGGVDEVSGIVRTRYGNWVPQGRATVYLVLVEPGTSSETLIGVTSSQLTTGFYQFLNVEAPPTANDYYKVVACFNIDNEVRVGTRPNVIPTNQFANVYMFTEPTGCPSFN